MISQPYKKLDIWKEAHELAVTVYGISRRFPREEAFGLTSQMRRSAVSVPANISEGSGRNSMPDFLRFLYIARGSIRETTYYCQLSTELGYLDHSKAESLIRRYEGLDAGINSFIESIKIRA